MFRLPVPLTYFSSKDKGKTKNDKSPLSQIKIVKKREHKMVKKIFSTFRYYDPIFQNNEK